MRFEPADEAVMVPSSHVFDFLVVFLVYRASQDIAVPSVRAPRGSAAQPRRPRGTRRFSTSAGRGAKLSVNVGIRSGLLTKKGSIPPPPPVAVLSPATVIVKLELVVLV